MHKKFILSLITIFISLFLSSCSSTDSTIKMYDDKFWTNESEIRIGLDTINFSTNEGDKTTYIKVSDQMDDRQKKTISKVQDQLKSYFLKVYGVDISEKLKIQKIKFFRDKYTIDDSWTSGYVLPKEPNVIYLNVLLLTNKSSKLESSYIHEAMHTLGIHSAEDITFIDEGFAESESEDFAKYYNINYSSTKSFYNCKALAKQMKIANPNLIKNYISNNEFSIMEEINERLSNVKMPSIKISKPGESLETYLKAFASPESYSTNNYSIWLSFQSQEIVANYCKQFKLDNSQIQEVRKNYIFENYEVVKVIKDKEGYNLK